MGLLDPSTSDGRVIFFLPWQIGGLGLRGIRSLLSGRIVLGARGVLLLFFRFRPSQGIH